MRRAREAGDALGGEDLAGVPLVLGLDVDLVRTPSARIPRSSHTPETPVPVPISTTERASSSAARKRSADTAAGAGSARSRPPPRAQRASASTASSGTKDSAYSQLERNGASASGVIVHSGEASGGAAAAGPGDLRDALVVLRDRRGDGRADPRRCPDRGPLSRFSASPVVLTGFRTRRAQGRHHGPHDRRGGTASPCSTGTWPAWRCLTRWSPHCSSRDAPPRAPRPRPRPGPLRPGTTSSATTARGSTASPTA